MKWLTALLVLIPSLASAQDMPDIVQVTVNLAFALPTQATPVTVLGTAMYQNSGPTPGYISQNFVVSGEGVIDNRQRVGPYAIQPIGCCPSFLWLQAPWADAKNPTNTGYTAIEVTWEKPPTPNSAPGTYPLPPGTYPISGRYENVAGPPYVQVQSNFFVYATGGAQSVAAAGGGGGGVVISTPELAILRRQLGLLGPRLGGKVAGIFNPTLQRVTAWGAAKVLRAPSWGDSIYLQNMTLEVIESCSGLDVMKWLAILAVICLAVGRASWPWSLVILAAVPLIAIEVNILRVVGIGLAYESYGWAVKEWMGWGALSLGIIEVAGVGAMVRRRAR